jgi:CHAT domain-containing protein
VERQLLNDLSEVYSGYFVSLSNQGRTADAFHVIERARGRVEAQALTSHEVIAPHELNPTEKHLTELNLVLLNTDESAARGHILDVIYQTEQQLKSDPTAIDTPPEPVALSQLQSDLRPSEVFIEYVLDSPHSYALAVTHQTAHRYTLPSKDELEQEATRYRSEILEQREDRALAQQLFNCLLGGIQELNGKRTVIVVPDGKLHLLPFSALTNDGHYVLTSHLVTVVPSGTVLDILRHRVNETPSDDLPYVGVAAWTTDSRSPSTLLTSIRRAVSGPERKELVALPESRNEVETIATDLPQPYTILLGDRATETNFKRLPLNRYNVVHLALHGYVDPVFPDRSALVFAPQQQPTDDSLLQVREIRRLHLNANLVTLSACNTSVGQVGEEGAANIVNAFIEARSQSVVSTLWELEDHATTHLMTVFYKHLGHHEEKAEALREAQLEMLNSGSPPYYWAGFVLNGEPADSLFRAPDGKLSSRSTR